MGEKKMADGFLAPTGKFYPKTENFHAQTARAIFRFQDGQTDEPIQELLRRGYILFVGFHKPGEPENLHADMDYVLGETGVSGNRKAEGLDRRTYGRAIEKAAV